MCVQIYPQGTPATDYFSVLSSMPTHQSWSISNFDIGRLLGRGSFGSVYLAREKKSGYIVALKVLWKSVIKRKKLEENVRREIDIQYHLRHPNVARLYTVMHDAECIFLVVEYCPGGDLLGLLEKEGRLEEDVVAG